MEVIPRQTAAEIEMSGRSILLREFARRSNVSMFGEHNHSSELGSDVPHEPRVVGEQFNRTLIT